MAYSSSIVSFRRLRLLLLVAAIGVGSPASAFGSDLVLSPTVMATVAMRTGSSELQQLEFLVLWRGKPNWFTGPGESLGGSQSTPTSFVSISRRAGIDLGVSVDLRTRTAIIQGVPVDLQGGNVVFVDNVDGGGRGTIVTVMQIEAGLLMTLALDPTERLLPILRASPQFAAFLQCDRAMAPLPGFPNVCPRLLMR
jgi:hypothetical protein